MVYVGILGLLGLWFRVSGFGALGLRDVGAFGFQGAGF